MNLLFDPGGVLWMEAREPEPGIFKHLPCGKTHNWVHILADERTGVIARALAGVNDPRRDRQEVLKSFAGRFQRMVRSSTRFSNSS